MQVAFRGEQHRYQSHVPKWKIERLSAADYVPKTMILYVNGSGDEVALLRSVIFLLEKGAEITFPK